MPVDLSRAQEAIASIESGGNYSNLGPITRTGDRAYGKYQTMGANIPTWTQQVLGKAMTPEQFLANPQAQDAVFNAVFGGYANQYGPAGAAAMWFTGRPAPSPNVNDNHTTAGSYVSQFMNNYAPGSMATPPNRTVSGASPAAPLAFSGGPQPPM